MNRDSQGFRISVSDEMRRAFDPYAHAVTVINEAHRLIHDGYFFDCSGIVASVANGASSDILLKLPAGTFGHLTFMEYSVGDSPCDVFFYEGTTVSADGTAANVRNHNRSASDTSNTGIYTGPTVTDVGTLLHTRYIPGAAAPGQSSGTMVAGEDAEWVLGNATSATNYMWRITNNSGGAIKLSFHMNGYEIGYES